MSRGGYRPGAGRKPGSSNKKKAADAATVALREKFKDSFDADVLNEDAIDTVEYARMVFRQHFKDTGDIESLRASVACARDSLPYKLPKLTATKTEVSVTNPFEGLSDQELIAAVEAGAREANDDSRPH